MSALLPLVFIITTKSKLYLSVFRDYQGPISESGYFRNITGSQLAFRIAVDEPEITQTIQAETYDYYAHSKTWGMEAEYVPGLWSWIAADATPSNYLNLN